MIEVFIENGEVVERELSAEEVAAVMVGQPRRLLPKSTVTSRLIALGRAAEVKAGFDANPEAFFRWTSPDWPNVYADDEGLLAFLDVLGLTEEQIAGVVAP